MRHIIRYKKKLRNFVYHGNFHESHQNSLGSLGAVKFTTSVNVVSRLDIGVNRVLERTNDRLKVSMLKSSRFLHIAVTVQFNR